MTELAARGLKYPEASRYLLPPDEIRRRMKGLAAGDVIVANHLRLEHYLYTRG